jgi:hypothetical protein
VSRYRELADTILSPSYLNDRIDSLTQLVGAHATSEDLQEVERINDQIRQFVAERSESVAAELSTLP